MLELYQKYRENLAGNLRLLESGEIFRWGEEKTLLLWDIDEGDYYDFISPLENLLKKIVEAAE